MPTILKNQFYEINVLDFGADPTGATDSSTAFQLAFNYARDNNYKRVYIPLAKGQIYLIAHSINIDFTDVFIYGDAGITFLTDSATRVPGCGYIKSSITNDAPIFNVKFYSSPSSTGNPVGSCTIEGLCFYMPVNANVSNTNKKAIRFINADNAPQRNVKVSKCTCFGFDSFINVDLDTNQTPDKHSVVIGYFTMENCIISGCKTAVQADYSIMGSVIRNNQFLNGTRLKGLFCAETIFKNNVFDNIEHCFSLADYTPSLENMNPKNAASPVLMYFERNSLRQISGEYFMRFQGNDADNLICIGDNFSIEQCDVVDIFLLEGTNSFRLLDSYNNVKTKISQHMQRRASVVLNPISYSGETNFDTHRATLHLNSSLNRQNFYFIPNDNPASVMKRYAAACLPYNEYCRGLNDPTTGSIRTDIGNYSTNTPYGPTTQAVQISLNSSLNNFEINGLTYGQSIPHCTLVISMLVKFDNISVDEIVHPEIEILDSNGVLIQLIKEPELKYGFNNKWLVLTLVCSNHFSQALDNSVFISVKISDDKITHVTGCIFTISGIGAYVVPQTEIDNLIYNSNNHLRSLIRPFVPY